MTGDPKANLTATFDAVARLAMGARCLGCTFQAAAFGPSSHAGTVG